MIYKFVKAITWVALRVFFRNIFFYNTKVIKKDTPTLFAVNHPTAFLDPIFVASHVQPKTYTMLRGDVFGHPAAAWFLDQIGTIPIFRFRNGFSGLRQNQETFERCYDILHRRKCISIMSEGSMKHEKRLRTIQKGTAKMAIGAFEKYGDKDIEIIPIGVSYSDSTQFRSVIMASVGEPIRIADYLDVYNENPRKAVLQITRKIDEQLKARVIHIENPEDDKFVDQILDLHRHDVLRTIWPAYSDSNDLLEREMGIVRKINAMPQMDKDILKQQTDKYYSQLAAKNLTDRGVVQKEHANILSTLFLIIGAIPYLWGFLTNLIPFTIAKKLAKAKAKQIEFYSSLRLGTYLGTYTLQYLLLLIIAVIIGNAYLWVLILATPVLGYFAVLYQDKFKFWMEAQWVDENDRQYFFQNRRQILAAIS